MADRLTATWSGQRATPWETAGREAAKLSKTFASLPSAAQRDNGNYNAPGAAGFWDAAPRTRSHLAAQKLTWHEITPSPSQGSASSLMSCSASLGRTSWTPDACASPHAVGPALAAGPALPVWTTWNEMRFSQAAIELQRPVQRSAPRRNDDTPSSVGNDAFEYTVPKNIRLLDPLSEESQGSNSRSSGSHVAFITIDDCVSLEGASDTPTPTSATAKDSSLRAHRNNGGREKADRQSQSWPRAAPPPRMRLADVKKASKKAQGSDHWEFGAGSGGEEPQPPTPRMILKQLRDSGRSRGSNRSSHTSTSRASTSRANSKSNSMKQRIARSSSRVG